jgi:hypothetical protein
MSQLKHISGQTQSEKNMRQKGAAFPFHHNYNSAGENVPLSSEEDKQKYELDFANKVGLHIQASSMLHSNYAECGTDVIISANTYTVCNGLSNQLLGHAAYVANLIKSGKKVAIPDAFIVNGVQSEKNEDGQTLKNIIPTKENSVGNSVSTFSAAQTALRRGSNSSWYNSRSIPLLADFLKVGVIPVVYTYTEQSQAMGKFFSRRQSHLLGVLLG